MMDPLSGNFAPVSNLTMRDVVMNFEYMRTPEGVSEADWKKFQSDIRQMDIDYREVVKSGRISPTIVALQDFLKSKFALKSYAFMK